MALPKLVVWTELAVSDYERVLDYLNDHWGNKVVREFVATTDEATEILSRFPRMFMLINKRKGIRRCVLTKHNSLYYVAKRDSVEILRMSDNRRDPKNLKL